MGVHRPYLHVVFEILGQVLVVEKIEYLRDLNQRSEDDSESARIGSVLLGQVHGVVDQLGELGGEVVQNKLDLLPQFLRLHFEGVFFKNGGGRLQHA